MRFSILPAQRSLRRGARLGGIGRAALLALLALLVVNQQLIPRARAATTVLFVKADATGADDGSSWANAYTTVQSALAAASPASGDIVELWVAAATYKPTTADRTLSFTLKNNVEVYGGFAGSETQREQRDIATNVTILSGDIGAAGDNSDNSYHVVQGGGTNSSAILDGFTITAGKTDTRLCPFACGAGMYNETSSPILRNLIFVSNSAYTGYATVFSGPTLQTERPRRWRVRPRSVIPCWRAAARPAAPAVAGPS